MAFTEEQEKQIIASLGGLASLTETVNKLATTKQDPPKVDPPKTDPGADPILDKIKKEEDEKKKGLETTQEVERVISFIHGVNKFLEDNAGVLPEETNKIVEMAGKETYETHKEKAGSIQAAIMKSFFAVQENLDSLTGSQKKVVETFMKLSQTAKVSGASEIFESVFEPAVHAASRVKKANELNKAKSGVHQSTKAEDAFLEKMRAKSQAAYNFNRKKA